MSNTKDILNNYEKTVKEKEDRMVKLVEEYTPEEEDEDEESIYYSKFAEEGTDAIKTMTGFYISEFMELYSTVEKILKVRGRGKQPAIGAMDSFFFTLVMLKHY